MRAGRGLEAEVGREGIPAGPEPLEWPVVAAEEGEQLVHLPAVGGQVDARGAGSSTRTDLSREAGGRVGCRAEGPGTRPESDKSEFPFVEKYLAEGWGLGAAPENL